MSLIKSIIEFKGMSWRAFVQIVVLFVLVMVFTETREAAGLVADGSETKRHIIGFFNSLLGAGSFAAVQKFMNKGGDSA